MSRSIAKLYKHAICEGKINIIENKEKLLQNLEIYPVRTVKQLIKTHNLSNETLENYCSDLFSTYEGFIVIGCPLSTDIDVICVLDEKFQSNGKPFMLLETEFIRLEKELREIGYVFDSRNKLDINLITIDQNRGTITSLLKGGRETSNMIMSTYKYHKQKYECPNLEFTEVDILEKCRTISKFMLDHLENISIDYESIRNEKKESYGSTLEMLEFSKRLGGVLDINNINSTVNWQDDIKSLTMKFCQLILLQYNIYVYTKMEISDETAKVTGLDSDKILWLLTRGNNGTESRDTILVLYKMYVDILNTYQTSILHIFKTIHFSKINVDTDELLAKVTSFFNSPNFPTEEFENEWNINFSDSNVNSVFINKSTPENSRGKLVNLIGLENMNHFIWSNQRSEEWLELLKFYTCGTNSKEIPSGFAGKYNLIRGAIAELLICNDFQFENFDKIQVGLLVDSNEKGARGCAPDLLLINESELIPVEIKCLRNSTKNSEYYDHFDLAQKQCKTVKNIIDKINRKIVKRKIVILSWFSNNALEYEICTMNY